jgi:hypothetical protein
MRRIDMDIIDHERMGIVGNPLFVNEPPNFWIYVARRKMSPDFFFVLAKWDNLLYYKPFNRFIAAWVLPVLKNISHCFFINLAVS